MAAPLDLALGREWLQGFLDSEDSWLTLSREQAQSLVAALDDADKWRAAEAEGHVVDFSKTGYGLQHPPSCRPNLIGCRFNRFLAKQGKPLRAPGRWRMQWTGKEPTFEAVS